MRYFAMPVETTEVIDRLMYEHNNTLLEALENVGGNIGYHIPGNDWELVSNESLNLLDTLLYCNNMSLYNLLTHLCLWLVTDEDNYTLVLVDYINERVSHREDTASDILIELGFELESIWDESGALYHRPEDGIEIFLWEDGFVDIHE